VPICFSDEETFLDRGPTRTLVLLVGYSVGYYCFSNV
jgi:hypothetical protein